MPFNEELGRLSVTIDPRFQAYDRGLDRARKKFDHVHEYFTARAATLSAGMSRRFSTIASALAGAFTLSVGAGAVAAMGAAFAAGIRGASDLEESLNKARETFGESAGEIIGYAEQMRRKFGQLEMSTLDAAARFDAFAGAAGLVGRARADFTKTMTQLAADFSSFQNVSFEEAVTVLASGLAGEAEPLRRYGKLLLETNVRQFAYAAGIARTGAELTEQQKVLGRYVGILAQTRKEQGDLARTAGSMANQTKALSGNFRGLLASLGQSIGPLTLGLVAGLNRAVGAIGAFLQDNTTRFRSWAAALTAANARVMSIVGKAFGLFRSFLGWLAARATELYGYSDATTLLGDAWLFVNDVWAAATTRATELWTELSKVAEAINRGVGELFGYASGLDLVERLWGHLRDTVSEAVSYIGVIFRNWSLILEEAVIRARGWAQNMVTAARWVGEAFGPMMAWIGRNWWTLLKDMGANMLTFLNNLWTNIRQFGQAFWEFMTSGFDVAKFNPDFTPLTAGFRSTVEQLPRIAAPVWADIQGQIDGVRDRMVAAEQEVADRRERTQAQVRDFLAGRGAAGVAAGGATSGMNQLPGGGGKGGEPPKAEFVRLDEFARKMQTAVLGGDRDKQGQIASNTARQVQLTGRMAILLEQLLIRAQTGQRIMV